MSDNSPHTTVDSATSARAVWRSLRSSQSLRRVGHRMAAVITVANIFSVATIATTDEKNPIEIVKKSGSVFAKVWQQSMFIGLGLGVLQLLIMMVGFVLIISSAIFLMTTDIIAGGAVLGFVAIAIIAWAIVLTGSSSLLQSVVMAAAYY